MNKLNSLKTPCFILDEKKYLQNISRFQIAFESRWKAPVILGYSIKTNHHPYLMTLAKKHHWYAEAVSMDEYNKALECGYPKNRIILNGPTKKHCIIDALINGTIVNLDNLDEIDYLIEQKKYYPNHHFSVGLRVNFDLEKACPKETTCLDEVNRFGICYENNDLKKAYERLTSHEIEVIGLHMHASTSSRSLKVFETLSNIAGIIACELQLNLKYVDIGGGYFGTNVYYPNKPSYDEYAEVITHTLQQYFDPTKVALILEPGACVISTAIDYFTRVSNIRNVRGQQIVTMDGTSLDINPFMKSMKIPCTLLNGEDASCSQVIAGSTCMEMDRFLPLTQIRTLTKDSSLLFHLVGAYTMCHNSYFINNPPRLEVINKEMNFDDIQVKTKRELNK